MAVRGRWPRLSELDRTLYQQHDLDPRPILPTVPAGLLYGVQPGSMAYIEDSREIGLTVAGVDAIGLGDRELTAFIGLVQYAVEVERAFVLTDDPDARAPLTAAMVADRLGLPDADREVVLVRLAQMLRAEGTLHASAGGLDTAAWHIDLDNGVRRYRHVTSVAEFIAAKPVKPSPTPAGDYYATDVLAHSAGDGGVAEGSLSASDVLSMLIAVALSLAGAAGGVAAMRLCASIVAAFAAYLVFRRRRSGLGWRSIKVLVPMVVGFAGLVAVVASFVV